MHLRAFVQARMSSSRFPGKVLAPLAGKPLIDHVMDRVAQAVPRAHIVVAMSTERTDDPLAAHVASRGLAVFRGPLDDVVARFQGCLRAHPCERFYRVCADSPLVDPKMLEALGAAAEADASLDLVTNVQRRTFPRGQSAELLRAAAFARLDPAALTREEREHVTKHYYDHPQRFRIRNLESGDASLGTTSLAVDTVEDLARLERLLGGSRR